MVFLKILILYVPEFSHPSPSAIANVEYPPFDFTETCSAHTRSLFWFKIDKFTILEFWETPLIEIKSDLEYEDKSVWTDNLILISDTTFVWDESILLESKNAAAIIITTAMPPNPKNNLEFFDFELLAGWDSCVVTRGSGFGISILGISGVIVSGFLVVNGFLPRYCSASFWT